MAGGLRGCRHLILSLHFSPIVMMKYKNLPVRNSTATLSNGIMQVAFTFIRRKNFCKQAQYTCAFLLVIIYLVLNRTFSNQGSRNGPKSNSKWPIAKSQPNCSFFDGSLMPRQVLGSEAPRKRQILLMAYHRGGSTFLGQILNSYPGAFLHFEPLLLVSGNEQVRTTKEIAAALDLLRKLYSCRFGARIRLYHHWPRSCLWYIQFNLPALEDCRNRANFCYGHGLLNALCASHKIQIAKVLRLRLDHAKQLLRKLPDLRIVHLTRDPRGLYNSRHKWQWCNATRSCIDPEIFCADMRRDLAKATKLQEQFPDRIIQIRYHDLATDTMKEVDKLLDFLELPRSTVVDDFVRTHTIASKEGKEEHSLLTTYRDSKHRPFLWQQQLSDEAIARVEEYCSDVIQHLGFNLTLK